MPGNIKVHWIARQFMAKPWEHLRCYAEEANNNIALMFKAHAELLGLRYPYENGLDFFNNQYIDRPKVFTLCVCFSCKNRWYSSKPVESCLMLTCPACDLIGTEHLKDGKELVRHHQYIDLCHFLRDFTEEEKEQVQQILELYYGD